MWKIFVAISLVAFARFFLLFLQALRNKGKFFRAFGKEIVIDLKAKRAAARVSTTVADQHCESDGEDTDFDSGNARLNERFSPSKIPSKVDYIVIGAGCSGLASAVMLGKLGNRVLVLEQHTVAGGTLHTFMESGCEFDTGFHYVGADPRVLKMINRIICSNLPVNVNKHYDKVILSDGTEFNFVAPEQNIIKDLQNRWPKYSTHIEKVFHLMRRANRYMHLQIFLRVTFPDWFNTNFLKPLLSVFYSDIHGKSTQQVYDDVGIPDGTLFQVLNGCDMNLGGPPERLPFVMYAAMFRHYTEAGSFYPVGGVKAVVQAMINAVEFFDGKVLMRAKVEKILLNSDGSVRGVRVKGGTEIQCSKVITSIGITSTMNTLPEHIVDDWKTTMSSRRSLSVYNEIEGFTTNSLFAAFEYMKPVGASDEQTVCSGDGFVVPTCNIWSNGGECFISVPAQKQAGEGVPLKKQTFILLGGGGIKDVLDYHINSVKRKEGYEEYKKKWQDRHLKLLKHHYPQLNDPNIKLIYCSYGTPLTTETYLGRFSQYGRPVNNQFKDLDFIRCKSPVNGLYVTGEDIFSPGVYPAMLAGLFCAGQAAQLLPA